VTDVMTTYLNPISLETRAIRAGSSGSGGSKSPCGTEQNRQLRVHLDPIIRKVAVWCEKHSQMFGHLASWHTVCSRSRPIIPLTFSKADPVGRRRLSQSGFWINMVDLDC